MPVVSQRWKSLLAVCCFCSASALAAPSISGCEQIATGPGPDDMAVQSLDTPRLIISSHDRRHFSRAGDIYAYTPASGQMQLLKREGEPSGFKLRPHGIDLVQRDGRWLLHVISHDRDLISDQHSLMIYELVGDTLRFQQQLRDPLLSAPNDVAVADNGDLYVTNERMDGDSIAELIFLQRKANVVVYRPGSGWRIATSDLAVSNGIFIKGNSVWVSQTLGEGLMRYQRRPDGTLAFAETLGMLSLLDSLHLAPNGHLLSVSYPSLLNLGWHWQSKGRAARTLVYDIDPNTGESQIIFQDDGRTISAVSSAVILGNRLYLGQLFDSFLLSCPWPATQTQQTQMTTRAH